jgi:hypothetical protein
MAISILYNPLPTRLFEADGDFAAGAKAYFYLARTTAPMAVYTDAPLMVAHTWPVIADAYGLLPPIYIQKGDEYKVRIEDALGSILYAADGIDNPVDPELEAGTGGGVAVAADEIFQTGDVMWNPASGIRGGWVRCNARTISKGIGTGTEANNDDCHDLFAFLWNNFPDYICPVTPGGRGPNAEADWNAPKSIATIDMRGFGAAGLDDMGNTAKNFIQKQTTISTTLGSPNAIAADITGLCQGMRIVTANFPFGAEIIYFSSSIAVMSANATATATDTPARFSVFYDAQVPGSGGGEPVHYQSLTEVAAHTHRVVHGADGIGFSLNVGTYAARRLAFTNDGPSEDVVAANSGDGRAMNNQSPMRLGTFYMKK